MNSEREQALRASAGRHGQEHIFRFYDELDRAQRGAFLAQVEAIDFELVAKLTRDLLRAPATDRTADLVPAEVIALPRDAAQGRQREAARQKGEELLRAGRVATFVVAGGQASRLGLDAPKGTFEIGPVTRRSLFEIHALKIRALSRRYGARLPWLVMTSEGNHDDTVRFFEGRDHFGLDPEDVWFFRQAMLPALDAEGKVLLESRERIFTSPDGHGGSLKALHRSGSLERLRERGIDSIFYFQVDNPLVDIADPVFLGYHALEEAEMSSKVVRKRDWKEKVGVVGRCNGRLTVIEYSDLPEVEARAAGADGGLKFWAGSVAIHVLSVPFVERLNQGGFHLPYHVARKKIACCDAQGRRQEPSEKNGVKFETFVFDALGQASRAVTFESAREDEFSPVKNAEGEDSPATCRADLTAQSLRWLEAAGARVEREPDGSFRGHVEISPLTALRPEDLIGKVPAGTVVREGFCI